PTMKYPNFYYSSTYMTHDSIYMVLCKKLTNLFVNNSVIDRYRWGV
uniref:Uncharacterized protein n=1 Tax=Panagrolaimus sp. JU765 TaxID=591449 RepID=A0AC34R9Z1_9BILA